MKKSVLSFTCRLAKGLLIAGAAWLLMVSGVTAQENRPDLKETVVSEMSQRTGDDLSTGSERSTASTGSSGRPGTQVNVMRKANTSGTQWAFGSSIVEAPKKEDTYPEAWLFVARNTGNGWQAELEGTPEFAALTDRAPEKVVGEREQKILAKTSAPDTGSNTGYSGQESTGGDRTTAAAAPTKTGLMLPWLKGTSWTMSGGPHGWATGYDQPYSTLDLTGRRGGDQRVRAAGGGRAYKMCSSSNGGGYIRIYHPNGLRTDYYHLWNTAKFANGASISRGAGLGATGEDLCGGGAVYGRHVHFSLMAGDNRLALNNRMIGGWVFKEGEAYGGYAQAGSTVRRPGSLLPNYGVS